MKKLDVIAVSLLVVGGLNWGLVGLAGFDLVALISGAGVFGAKNAVGAFIYVLVGAAALYQALGWKSIQRRWVAVTAMVLAFSFSGLAQAGSCGSQGTTSGAQGAHPAESTGQWQKAMKDTAVKHDLVDVAVQAGGFQTLVAAVQAAGLVDVLKGKGPFTVFAPTDDAFAKLPAGTLEALLQDPDKLASILTYHVVAGKLMAQDVVKLSSTRTVQGQNVTFKTDQGVRINEANVIQTDIAAANGVIHVIDAVILPKDNL